MAVDYRLAFELAPVGLCVSRNRSIVDCNAQLCEMFGWSRELLVGQSFLVLYPSADEYERLGARMAPILNAKGHYSDDRTIKRASGGLLRCPRTGRAPPKPTRCLDTVSRYPRPESRVTGHSPSLAPRGGIAAGSVFWKLGAADSRPHFSSKRNKWD